MDKKQLLICIIPIVSTFIAIMVFLLVKFVFPPEVKVYRMEKFESSSPSSALPAPSMFHEYVVDGCSTCSTVTSESVYVGKSALKGRGVFAKKAIKEGEVIEISPVLLELRVNIPPQSIISDYIFSSGIDGEVAISLGYGALYNHRDDPNAKWIVDRYNRVLDVRAVRDIAENEEIFVSYGEKYWSTRTLDKKE